MNTGSKLLCLAYKGSYILGAADFIRTLPKERVIVLDNAIFHKGKAMQKMLEDAGHSLLYLPPYFPDLNPIEKKWAQAKNIRRTLTCSIDLLF
ncbi:transposase [Holospora undulata]|nr:transposase [Holospora undulata]